jgi:hypothetical protein
MGVDGLNNANALGVFSAMAELSTTYQRMSGAAAEKRGRVWNAESQELS